MGKQTMSYSVKNSMSCETPKNQCLLANSDSRKNGDGYVLQSCCGAAELMTEAEVVQFLRIPEISGSKDYHNVIEHLKRNRSLPRIHICRKALYPRKAILDWVEKETNTGE